MLGDGEDTGFEMQVASGSGESEAKERVELINEFKREMHHRLAKALSDL